MGYRRPLDVVDGGRVERATPGTGTATGTGPALPSAWSAVKTVFRSVQLQSQLQRPVSVFIFVSVFDEEAGLDER